MICALILLLAIADCKENAMESGGSLAAMTQETSYGGITRIIVTLKNETKRVAYFTHYNYDIGIYIERKDTASWVDEGNDAIVCLAIYLSGIIPLEPMQSKVDTILFYYSTGTYRLKYLYGWQQDRTR
jgi:hypothetical protein